MMHKYTISTHIRRSRYTYKIHQIIEQIKSKIINKKEKKIARVNYIYRGIIYLFVAYHRDTRIALWGGIVVSLVVVVLRNTELTASRRPS